MTADQFFLVTLVFAFAFGAVIGSFLNVVIYRVPAGLSVVRPGSRCPHCETPIRWYDNIPILSYLILRGRCRHCRAGFSARYALVEGLVGVLSAGLWWKVAGPHFRTLGGPFQMNHPPPVPDISLMPWGSIALIFAFYFFFLAILVVITFVDIDHYLIPHEFTLPAMVVGLVAAAVLNSDLLAAGSLAGFFPPVTFLSSLIGLIVGALAVILIFYGYFALRGIEGIGGGDVTLMAVMGAWLGWPALLFIFFAASVQGILAAGVAALFKLSFLKDSREILAMEDPRQTNQVPETSGAAGEAEELNSSAERDDETAEEEAGGLAVPFGPFICLAGVQFFFFGEFLGPSLSMSYLYYGF